VISQANCALALDAKPNSKKDKAKPAHLLLHLPIVPAIRRI
jgi:hypothetical protein